MIDGIKRGYCAVTADILHPGHIRYIKRCASMCDHLTVGVMSDECVKQYKGEYPIMTQEERLEIVRNLRFVGSVVLQDKFDLPESTYYHIIFDSVEHQRKGADCFLAPMTGISSTIIKERIIERANNCKRKV